MTRLNDHIMEELARVVGKEHVLTSPEDLICYSYDATYLEHRPDLVVSPASLDEVVAIMRIAYEESIPVVPRGMGSGLAGGSVPIMGGIVLNLTRLNRILEVDEDNMMVRVEAGVITADLQMELESRGLFYPPDPASVQHSTIGGNVACNAGGPRCLKYGVTGDYVKGLAVVLADGRVLLTGGKIAKNSTGYRLTNLFIGSEGTLGIIVEVLLKILASPQYVRTAMVVFSELEAASEAVTAMLGMGILPVAIELMDETVIATIEAHLHLGLPLEAEAILILEVDGNDESSVALEMNRAVSICKDKGASEVEVAENEVDRANLWQARRALGPSVARRSPFMLGEDISVPRSAVPEAVRRLKRLSRKYDLPVVIYGHAGDGNLHPNILFDRTDPEQWSRVQEFAAEIFATALELGGTLSGEHGVGVLKRPFMQDALGPVALNVMRLIKDALDPKGMLNPGKVLI